MGVTSAGKAGKPGNRGEPEALFIAMDDLADMTDIGDEAMKALFKVALFTGVLPGVGHMQPVPSSRFPDAPCRSCTPGR